MEKKLQRNEQEKTIAGVCAGLAEYFDVDVTWIRIAFVLAVLAGFSGVLAYIVLWIAVPAKPFNPNYSQFNADYKVYDNAANPGGPVNDPTFTGIPYPKKKKSGNGGVMIGLLFVIFGAFFLLDEFHFVPYWFEFHKLWPLVFIIPGIMMIANANKRSWKEEWKEKQRAEQEAKAAAQPGTAAATEETTIIADENTNKEV
ncbi:PspC domain-containing protein [Daejeonella sp. JGW-45]|uniref:PspC domain-containing protein n=1 Tax=Daejeonella sp. JGW-45 TaxID=3034148 RepID=UPI0023EE1E78|nr:PspC domain-containing protein [Daejeonella sp. JGW-45]